MEVELLDINDNLPQFEVDLYNISIVENLPNGFSVLQVIATDQDQVRGCLLLSKHHYYPLLLLVLVRQEIAYFRYYDRIEYFASFTVKSKFI